MEGQYILANAMVYLLAAVIMVPIAARLGLGSVLGYLLAGIAIGPWGMRMVIDPEAILHFAEFGVVLLLFVIGLELSPKELLRMRGPILRYGGGQLLLSVVVLTLLLSLAGLDLRSSVIGALGLALSSTAIALQILNEKGLLPTPAGQGSFAILLFQDLAVIPILALLPLAGAGLSLNGADSAMATFKALGVIAMVILAGHFVIPILLRRIAKTGIHELFTAFALLLVIGIALLMDAVGLSMALGSFLAGLLLAESEYRHALETVIDPFRGLLMGLFFIAVGMAVDFGLLLAQPLLVLGVVAGLVLLKAAVLYLLAKAGKLPRRQAPFFSLLLSQGGEFAFVVYSLGVAQGVLPHAAADLLVLVVALSMMTTPLLLALNQRFVEPRFAAMDTPEEEPIEFEVGHVIVAGFGRFGQVVGRLLHGQGIPVTLLDHNPDQIQRIKEYGFKVFFGDAGRLDLLRTAGAEKARLLVIAIDNCETALEITRLARQHFPNLKIVARAKDMMHLFALQDEQVEYAYREVLDSALHAGRGALYCLGYDREQALEVVDTFRAHDREVLQEMRAARAEGEQALARTSLTLRDRLNELYQEDAEEKAG
jgi:glutathione-regulated potassium-efflux system ancillary protein KefC